MNQQSESSVPIRNSTSGRLFALEGILMLFETTFSANTTATFPDNTVCLTFDDGPAEANTPDSEPGPHSLELAQYRMPAPPSLPRQAATMRRTSTPSEPAGLSIIERRSLRRFCERRSMWSST